MCNADTGAVRLSLVVNRTTCATSSSVCETDCSSWKFSDSEMVGDVMYHQHYYYLLTSSY